MNPDKIEAILRTITVLNALNGEQGSYRLGELVKWSHIPRATCDRYLKEMVRMKLLEKTALKYRGEECSGFAITEDGQDFYHQIY